MDTPYAYLSHALRPLQLYRIVITIYGSALFLLHRPPLLRRRRGMKAMAIRRPGERCWAYGNGLNWAL